LAFNHFHPIYLIHTIRLFSRQLKTAYYAKTSITTLYPRESPISCCPVFVHRDRYCLPPPFFAVETIRLQTIFVFFLIELGTRRVHLSGITQHPNGHWVTQQARIQVWLLQEIDTGFIGLIRDNDPPMLLVLLSSLSTST